jgi:ketosteroid isomerase-like protein
VPDENVEIVRKYNAFANARNWDEWAGVVHPDIEWRDQLHAPDVPEVVQGIADVQHIVSQWDSVYDGFKVEVLEFIDADPWVICVTRWRGEGKGSGTPVEVRSVYAYEVKDGKIVRVVGGYPDLTAAQTAIGLPG